MSPSFRTNSETVSATSTICACSESSVHLSRTCGVRKLLSVSLEERLCSL